ncbi:DUF6777 domain-containing protein [Streptomyces sp. NPDC052773]|uniref:DUF6777 domain-containing protein n=1 Tax=Streptomyces sp. NPDC052773 TaxID=3365693 RepID=UPI0037D588A3
MAVRVVLRRVAFALVCVLISSGCQSDERAFAVKAVAAGVPSLAPFFDEDAGLGHDAGVRSRPAPGGVQQGDTPGLYGGTREPEICDVDRLEEFLTDPANERKTQAWASVLGVTTDGIPRYLDRLTPVLLRTDTLVKNHDYKKEKAVPFDALLQAGIAILVDERGLPAVKCSCGNPLRPFEGDIRRISVRFEDGNEKWKGFDRSSVVAVRPAPRTLDRLALVDVEDPGRGIHRPAGTTGPDDSVFDAREPRAVPEVTGSAFGRASRVLAGAGLAVVVDGGGLPPHDARVTASDPPAGTELPFGAFVRVRVSGAGGGDGAGGGSGSVPGASGSSGSSGSSEVSGSGGSPGSPGSSGSSDASGSGEPKPSDSPGSPVSPESPESPGASDPAGSRDPSDSPGSSDSPGPSGPSGPSKPSEPSDSPGSSASPGHSDPPGSSDSPGSPNRPGSSGSPGDGYPGSPDPPRPSDSLRPPGSPSSAAPTRAPSERPPSPSPPRDEPPSSPASSTPPPSPPPPSDPPPSAPAPPPTPAGAPANVAPTPTTTP